jgi:hypothetical protein
MTASNKKAVLLIGSPRLESSTSKVLGDRLLQRLAQQGLAIETHFILRALAAPEKAEAMFGAVDQADVVVFAFPLYVDQLPAPVVWACEQIAARRRAQGATKRPLLTCLVQSGFPETHQNQPASDIMQRFAAAAGFAWAGGLIMGMGGAAGGRPLPPEPKGMLHNVLSALDRAAVDLAEGRAISATTLGLMGRKLMPYKFYFFMANFGMRREIKKNAAKTGKKIDALARPYAN